MVDRFDYEWEQVQADMDHMRFRLSVLCWGLAALGLAMLVVWWLVG